MNLKYDAIIVGGGHNGSTAAGYLSRVGLKTLVLERRPLVAVVYSHCHADHYSHFQT